MKKKSLLLALCLCLAGFSCSKEDKQSFANVDHDKDNGVIFEELAFVYPDIVVENFGPTIRTKTEFSTKRNTGSSKKEVSRKNAPPRVAKLSPSQNQTRPPARPTRASPPPSPSPTSP
jgi:hypothetical protein